MEPKHLLPLEVRVYKRMILEKGLPMSGRPGFNPKSRHTKDFKNGT